MPLPRFKKISTETAQRVVDMDIGIAFRDGKFVCVDREKLVAHRSQFPYDDERYLCVHCKLYPAGTDAHLAKGATCAFFDYGRKTCRDCVQKSTERLRARRDAQRRAEGLEPGQRRKRRTKAEMEDQSPSPTPQPPPLASTEIAGIVERLVALEAAQHKLRSENEQLKKTNEQLEKQCKGYEQRIKLLEEKAEECPEEQRTAPPPPPKSASPPPKETRTLDDFEPECDAAVRKEWKEAQAQTAREWEEFEERRRAYRAAQGLTSVPKAVNSFPR